jgi:hypothetical protein
VEIPTGKTVEATGGTVCSACSGDYAGDFENYGEPADDSGGGPPSWACGDPEANENRFRTEGAGGFEANANSEWDSQLASPAGSKDESAGEIYEIMVSATRIVEIRVIRANCEEIKEFRGAPVAEMRAARKHAKTGSAKYYRTRGGCAQRANDRVQVPCCRWVAASVAGQLKRCGRWARKALENWRARNF